MALKFQNKKVAYILMTLLVFMWGFEYVVAKSALETFNPITLVFCKYSISAVILTVVRLIQKRKFPLKKKHILTLIACSICGEILYFTCEYSAMDYLPVSIITIILAFVPMVSIVLEVFIDKKKPNTIIVIGIIVCILGVVLVIGVDIKEILAGRFMGYLLAFGAVIFWNGYNFITEKLSNDYTSFDLTFMQLSCTSLLTLPYAVFNFPSFDIIGPADIGGILYLGIVSALVGFMIYVFSISILGPTPCALYSNFLPVTSALFGWIFLGESLMSMQIVGGLVVISAGAVVIWQKGKLDETYSAIKEHN